MPVSKTYSLAIVGILNTVLPLFGFELFDSEALEQVINAVVLVGIAVDRLAKKDISVLGIRKTS